MNKLYKKTLIEDIKKAEKEINKGHYVTLEDLKKDFKNRIKNTQLNRTPPGSIQIITEYCFFEFDL